MRPLIAFMILLIFISCSTENHSSAIKYDPALDFPTVAWYHDSAFSQRLLPRIESDLPLSQNFDYGCTVLPVPRYGIQTHTNGAPADSFMIDHYGHSSVDLDAYNASQIPCECRDVANRYTDIGFCLQSAGYDTFHVYNSEIDSVLVSPFCLGRLPWGEEIGLWVVSNSDSVFYSVDRINSYEDYFFFPKTGAF